MIGLAPSIPDHSIELMRLVTGAWAARLVRTAVELGIADHLASGPRGVDFLAADIGAHERHLPACYAHLRPSACCTKAKSGCIA